jgi:5-methyltetrahydropteroyltriglutamate--homocysteine methyltransferase
MKIVTHNLGYPRIGPRRELKQATESYWSGRIGEEDLQKAASEIRASSWLIQKSAGIQWIPSNDFSFYDQILDACVLFGAVPERFGWDGKTVDLQTYFAMARGRTAKSGASGCCSHDHVSSAGIPAMEMTKWFDTNYHYIVPEWSENQTFRLSSSKPFDEFLEALSLGIKTKPVLPGPVSFILLGKGRGERGHVELEKLLENLLPIYAEVLEKLRSLGAEWVQLDEPCLVMDRTSGEQLAFSQTYRFIREKVPGLKVLLTTYFGALEENLDLAFSLPVSGLHLDFIRAPGQLESVLKKWPSSHDKILSAGIVDGRNIWKNDFSKSLKILQPLFVKLGPERLWLAPSCSLLHAPVGLEFERNSVDSELLSWLAFSNEKLREITWLARALCDPNSGEVQSQLRENAGAIRSRSQSPRVHRKSEAGRGAASGVDPSLTSRKSPFHEREKLQRTRFGLPLFPGTTIGSFPQTAEVRRARAKFKKGEWHEEEYERFIRQEIRKAIQIQEEIGLDVLVHGEFERNDMVEYFGEQLSGFAFTANGWVQSYGTRCVKPPIIFGDVSRPKPMTVRWSVEAQSFTKKPVKGMLTGPVTILQWSFVRDDQPRSSTCRQIAFAIREEVLDLEQAGIGIIQIDEPALREGLPLRRCDQPEYLGWAVDCFRLATSAVRDDTQIHTHMCYCQFDEIIGSIAALDADVISIESSRSSMELLEVFETFNYPNQIGTGVWDIHSPRVPSQEEIVSLLERATRVLPPERIWVNPDCGLKTRGWNETLESLENMVAAAKVMRSKTAGVAV